MGTELAEARSCAEESEVECQRLRDNSDEAAEQGLQVQCLATELAEAKGRAEETEVECQRLRKKSDEALEQGLKVDRLEAMLAEAKSCAESARWNASCCARSRTRLLSRA